MVSAGPPLHENLNDNDTSSTRQLLPSLLKRASYQYPSTPSYVQKKFPSLLQLFCELYGVREQKSASISVRLINGCVNNIKSCRV